MSLPAVPGLQNGQIMFENVQILWPNFAGNATTFKPAGYRSFTLPIVDPEMAARLASDGWTMRMLKDMETGEKTQPALEVVVKYRNREGQLVKRPPRIVLVTSRGRTELTEETAELVDFVDIAKVDCIIRPFNWVMNEHTPAESRGIKAYLKSIFVTIHEDPLELKYADVPEIGSEALDLAIDAAADDVIDVDSWEEPQAKALNAGSGTPPWDE